MKTAKLLLVMLLSFAVAACGGGGGSTTGADGGTPSYSISGVASAGATLSLSGQSTASTTADAAGSYAFTGLANGSYTVTPSLSSYSFAPTSTAVSINAADVPGINFVATASPAPMYSISGTVAGLGAGVTLGLSPGGASTMTDARGNYSFVGLASGGYTVTPLYAGYTFTPTSQMATVFSASMTGVNFTAVASPTPTYSISGNVSGLVSSGVTITLSPSGATAVTDTNGNYSLAGIVNGGYTVTPSLSGHTFTPASATATVNGANVTSVNFTEPVPVLATQKLFYPGFDAARKGTNGGVDQAIYTENLATVITTRLWGGFQCPPGGCGEMFPDIIVPARTGGIVVFQGSNIPCLAVMSLTTLNPVCGTVPWRVWSESTFDLTQGGDVAVISQRLDPINFPTQKNIVLNRIDQVDGAGGFFIVTNGVDIDTSPVIASAGNKNSILTLLFIRNGTEIRQQVVDPANGLLVGTATLFASNVVDGVRAMSVNAGYTHVAFMRKVGGVTHIFVKPLAGGTEVDLVAGTDPYWATDGSGRIMYTDNGALWAVLSDGTGKVQVPVPSNIVAGSLGRAVFGPAGY